MKIQIMLSVLMAVLLFNSCTEEGAKETKNLLLPRANGALGEIVTVIDSSQWAGIVGDALRDNVQIPMEALPQDEVLFDLVKVSPVRINDVLKRAKNLLYVITLDDPTEESRALRRLVTKETLQTIEKGTTRFVKVTRDEFANGQIIVFLFAKDSELLAQKIRENGAVIRGIFEKEELKRINDKLLSSREQEIEFNLTNDHGYHITVPFGYAVAKNLKNFVWIRQLDVEVDKNVFIYEEDYDTPYQLDRIADLREEITSTYLRDSDKPSLYITQQDILPMITDTVRINDKFALRNKGLWKNSDASGGGPYISYVRVDAEKGKLYYIEGYVYAPGRNKKNYVKELDAIISNFSLPTEVEAKK